MNKSLSVLAGFVFASTVSFSAWTGGLEDHTASPQMKSVNSAVSFTEEKADLDQVTLLSQRIDHLAKSLNTQKVETSKAFEMSEFQDIADEGMVHFDDEGGVLFESLSDTTFEVELLRNRSHFAERSLVLGGYLKVTAQQWGGDRIATTGGDGTTALTNGSGVYWLATMLDLYGAPNDWIAAFATFKGSNSFNDHDQLVLAKAFVSVGNTDRYPLFALMGKTYLPFGVFGGGGPLSPSVTRSGFRVPTTEQLWLGFDNHTFNSNLSIFRNDTDAKFSNFVLSFFMSQHPREMMEYTLGAGYLNDVRGTGSALGQAFRNIRNIDGTNRLSRGSRLALYNLNAEFLYGPVGLHAEFIKAFAPVSTGAAVNGLTTAGQNLGRPETWYLSSDYKMLLLAKPTIFSVGFSAARHTEGVMQPIVSSVGSDLNSYYGLKDVWVGAVTRELGHNFYLALEYQRAQSYFAETTRTVSLDLNYYF